MSAEAEAAAADPKPLQDAGQKTAETTSETNAEPQLPLQHHMLQHPWVLWYDSPGKRVSQNNWFAGMKKVAEFGTVEDFWGCTSRICFCFRVDLG